MSPRKSIVVAILAGLAAAGLGLYAVTRTWDSVRQSRPSPLPPETVTTTGTDLAGWAAPSGVVAIAAVVAVIAVSGKGRRAVAVCLGLAGLGLGAAGGLGVVRVFGVWPVGTLLAAAALVVIAVWTWRHGSLWPAMSARYDRAPAKPPSGAPVADDPAALWDALDRGVDPTSLRIGETAPGEECAR